MGNRIKFIQTLFNFGFTCVFKGHIVTDQTVNYLYSLKDDNTSKKLKCLCKRCNYPLLIYKIDKDNYAIIEDV